MHSKKVKFSSAFTSGICVLLQPLIPYNDNSHTIDSKLAIVAYTSWFMNLIMITDYNTAKPKPNNMTLFMHYSVMA